MPTEIILEKNLSDLVVEDRFFTCEKHRQSTIKNGLFRWVKPRKTESNNLWGYRLTVNEK